MCNGLERLFMCSKYFIALGVLLWYLIVLNTEMYFSFVCIMTRGKVLHCKITFIKNHIIILNVVQALWPSWHLGFWLQLIDWVYAKFAMVYNYLTNCVNTLWQQHVSLYIFYIKIRLHDFFFLCDGHHVKLHNHSAIRFCSVLVRRQATLHFGPQVIIIYVLACQVHVNNGNKRNIKEYVL